MAEPVPYEIRPVTKAEAAAWRELRLEMLKTEPLAFSSSYEDQSDFDLSFFESRIPDDGVDVLFGLYVDGALSGSAGFSQERDSKLRHKGVMWSVYLKPPLRGTGAAEALVRRVVEHARRYVVQLLCAVTADNPPALRLYRRLGFVEYGVEPRSLRVDGHDHDEVLLVISFD